MIDHIGLRVTDLARSKAFYDAAFAPLGIDIVMTVGGEITGGSEVLGYGPRADSRDVQAGKPSFWISQEEALTGPMHVAFVAKTRAAVDAFYAAAMAAGGKDNGPPGVRPHYHPNYYGAFVFDPDGRNVEAVCHAPA